MKILHLNLKGEYFDAIKAGEKKFEYRKVTDYWTKRILNREYDEVHFKRGYPNKTDSDKIIKVQYRGYELQTLTHKHFGNEPVEVYAIYTR